MSLACWKGVLVVLEAPSVLVESERSGPKTKDGPAFLQPRFSVTKYGSPSPSMPYISYVYLVVDRKMGFPQKVLLLSFK